MRPLCPAVPSTRALGPGARGQTGPCGAESALPCQGHSVPGAAARRGGSAGKPGCPFRGHLLTRPGPGMLAGLSWLLVLAALVPTALRPRGSTGRRPAFTALSLLVPTWTPGRDPLSVGHVTTVGTRGSSPQDPPPAAGPQAQGSSCRESTCPTGPQPTHSSPHTDPPLHAPSPSHGVPALHPTLLPRHQPPSETQQCPSTGRQPRSRRTPQRSLWAEHGSDPSLPRGPGHTPTPQARKPCRNPQVSASTSGTRAAMGASPCQALALTSHGPKHRQGTGSGAEVTHVGRGATT